MDIQSKIKMALVYAGFFILSAVVAVLIFKLLPGSGAEAEGDIDGLKINIGGGFAGFMISFWLLQFVYRKNITPKQALTLRGNTLDEAGHYIEGANIAVDGLTLGKQQTRENGVFEIHVNAQSEWTIRADKDELTAVVTIPATQVNQTIQLILKKKTP